MKWKDFFFIVMFLIVCTAGLIVFVLNEEYNSLVNEWNSFTGSVANFTNELGYNAYLDKRFEIIGFECTGSMIPTINCSDKAIMHKPPQDQLKIGDIISFWDINKTGHNESIAHRIVDIIDMGGIIYYQTQGDANAEPDVHLIVYDQIEGKIFAIFHDSER